MELFDYLPKSAREIAEVIGLDGLLRLVEAYGGTCIRVPGRHGLDQVLTQTQYEQFVHHWRNEEVSIPLLTSYKAALRRERARRLAAAGNTRAAIARELGVAERTVYQWLADEGDRRQMGLFE